MMNDAYMKGLAPSISRRLRLWKACLYGSSEKSFTPLFTGGFSCRIDSVTSTAVASTSGTSKLAAASRQLPRRCTAQMSGGPANAVPQ